MAIDLQNSFAVVVHTNAAEPVNVSGMHGVVVHANASEPVDVSILYSIVVHEAASSPILLANSYGVVVHTNTTEPVEVSNQFGIVVHEGPPEITSAGPSELPDDGGVAVVLTAPVWPAASYYVYIQDTVLSPTIRRQCYSGVIGQGAIVMPDGLVATVWVPPMPPGLYTIVAEPAVGATAPVIGLDMLTFIHRTLTSGLYSIRAHIPPPRYIGPANVEDEL